MKQVHDALQPELARLLLTRDLMAVIRHALDIEPDADAVNLNVGFDRNGLMLDVTYSKGRVPISGWGQ